MVIVYESFHLFLGLALAWKLDFFMWFFWNIIIRLLAWQVHFLIRNRWALFFWYQRTLSCQEWVSRMHLYRIYFKFQHLLWVDRCCYLIFAQITFCEARIESWTCIIEELSEALFSLFFLQRNFYSSIVVKTHVVEYAFIEL